MTIVQSSPFQIQVLAASSAEWPLSISSNGRYLQKPGGIPFFSIIDTAWCAPLQLSLAQMDAYVADCVARKINGIIMQLMDPAFSDNSPRTYDGIPPLLSSDFSQPNGAYFDRVDHLVQRCKEAGIVVWMWPLYVGLQPGGSQGWWAEYSGSSQAVRRAWGTYIADRYKNYGNIILVHGGDGTVPNFSVLNDYIDAMVTSWPNALHSYHAARTVSAFTAANGQSWLNLNNTYLNDSGAASPALTEYNRTPVRPLFLVEEYYENTGEGAGRILNILWQSLCSGCLAGIAYGHTDIWTFGGPGYDQNFTSHYGDPGRSALRHIRTLIDLYQWWKLQPSVGGALVTTALGSGNDRVCPMLASDSSFAWIYSPNAGFTLNKAAFSTAHQNIRIRSYDPSSGVFSTISASTPTTGTQAIASTGARVTVVDGA